MRYVVGLSESPQSIAKKFGGDYRKLLAANPHKTIVSYGGVPTFKSLGVGERINVPNSFVGGTLAKAFGVGSPDEAFARLAHTFGTSDPGDAFAKIAHTFGVHGVGVGSEHIGGDPNGLPFNRLPSGASLTVEQAIKSPNGRAMLRMQGDGNLVLYDLGTGAPIWASGTNGKGGVRADMQPDGNFVVYNAQHQPLWASGTDRHPGAFLAMQDDGNAVVYPSLGLQSLWASGTNGFRKAGGGGDIFSQVSHVVNQAANAANQAVTSAVHDLGKATGLPTDQVLAIAKNAANAAQKAVESGAQLVAKAGGDVGKFVAARAAAIAKDPLGTIAQIATTGPLALVGSPDDVLKALGIPTPAEILQKVGIPPFQLPNPEEVAKGITNPQDLLNHIPGLSQLGKLLPAMPNPQDFTDQIVKAASSGDPDKIKSAIIDVGHHVSDSMAMVPGLGGALSAPLSAAISAIESGSPLRTALELLLSQAPIPTDIKDIVMRPAIHGLSDIVEKQTKVEDALISAFKEGIMAEVQKRNLPAPAPALIGDLVDALIQVVLRNKPLDQAATGFAKQGLDEATKKLGSMLPAVPGLPAMPSIPGLPAGLPAGLPKGALPAGLPSIPGLSAVPAMAMRAMRSSAAPLAVHAPTAAAILATTAAPSGPAAKIASLQQAYSDLRGVGARSNEITALTQGIIKLNQQDPGKKDPTTQKQIQDMQTSIHANQMQIQASKQKIDTNIGARPPSHIAPAADVTTTAAAAVAAPVVPAPATAAPVAARAASVYGPYPAGARAVG
jgi:hypothetical protein